MTVQDIQSLINILGETSGVIDLSVTAGDGSSVSIKRASASPQTSLVSYPHESVDYSISSQEDNVDDNFAEEQVGGIIPSHLVGIFQATNPPIAVGSFIRNGQIVGYIESMKLLSELKSDIKGVVAEVFISDRQPVEYAQPLFRVVPSED